MGYRRVTREDRLRIKDGLDAGLTNAEIADKLGFHRSTIGREIRRNKGGRGLQAQTSPSTGLGATRPANMAPTR
jgi:IS30 family transposase